MKHVIRGARRTCLLGTLPAFALACASASSPGVSVEVAASPSLEAGQEFTLGSGTLRVDELRWTNAAVEIEACDALSSVVMDWLVPTAHAHGTSSPTELAVPALVTPMQSSRVGELRPSAGKYCAVRFHIGPADADTVGLTAAPQMLGLSFYMRGAYEPKQGDQRDFELESDRVFEVTREVQWELSEDQPSVTLSSSLDVERWMGQMDPRELMLSEEALLAAFQGSFVVSAR
jgi:hypothetical protein